MGTEKFEQLHDDWFNITDKVIRLEEVDRLQLQKLFRESFDVIEEFNKQELVPKQISKLLLDIQDFYWWVMKLEDTPLHAFYQDIGELFWDLSTYFLTRDYDVKKIEKMIDEIPELKGEPISIIRLVNESCVDQTVDAVVNAANANLQPGGGICGVIFRRANPVDMILECGKFATPLKTGGAVITPAFRMKNTKFIIHAVGPDFAKTPDAFDELFDAYYNSLFVLMTNHLHSISFPLISSGIYAGNLENPVAESTKQCCRAYKQFISDYPDYRIDVTVCAYTVASMEEAKPVFDSMI